MKPYLSIREIADELSVHPASVWRAIQVGLLPALKVGRVYRIDPADFAEFKARLEYRPRVHFRTLADHAADRALIDRSRPVQ